MAKKTQQTKQKKTQNCMEIEPYEIPKTETLNTSVMGERSQLHFQRFKKFT
jgi:hypothetical protein